MTSKRGEGSERRGQRDRGGWMLFWLEGGRGGESAHVCLGQRKRDKEKVSVIL